MAKMIDLTRLLVLLNAHTPQELATKQGLIRKELDWLNIKPKDKKDLINKIIKITKITPNPKVRESYLRYYFRIYQEGIKSVGRGNSIIIEITKKCTKHCIHCYSKFTGQRQEMSDKILNTLIIYARKNCKLVFLTGGEPTLDPRVFQLAKNNPDMMFFMFTNGNNITDEYAKKLSSFGNLIPLLCIDGSSADTHDFLRGNGSYQEVLRALEHLNNHGVSWGYISLVTEHNAREVLSLEFIQEKVKKGAFIARYLEYIPVSPNPLKELILSGETYYLLEKRKREIIKSDIIYMQETKQNKCQGVPFFTVDGEIKNCFCFHYAKYEVNGKLKNAIENMRKEWISYNWKGECPVYSDPRGFKNHLEMIGWKNISTTEEPYLTNPDISMLMMQKYKRFLTLKKQKEL
jgi:MoaA/NifB/PqqE/SkfB family radical SAM enzyme